MPLPTPISAKIELWAFMILCFPGKVGLKCNARRCCRRPRRAFPDMKNWRHVQLLLLLAAVGTSDANMICDLQQVSINNAGLGQISQCPHFGHIRAGELNAQIAE